MNKLFKFLVPKRVREYFKAKVREEAKLQETYKRIEALESNIVGLSASINSQSTHIENISNLLNTTVRNLESVGNNLIQSDQRYQDLEKRIGNTNDIEELENRINFIENISFHNAADIMPKTNKTKEYLGHFFSQFKVSESLNTNISKNDLMYLYSLLNVKNYATAYHSYLSTGLNGSNIVDKIALSVFKDKSNIQSILDFASGYGRVTRFLTLNYGNNKVWTSDIKTEAVEFQKRELNIHGFTSSYVPEEIKIEQRFDVIFVASLFSHLNKDLFKRWLKSLWNLLSDKGILIFTVHDMSLWKAEITDDLMYFDQNEDVKFKFVDDYIDKTESYGISFCKESFVANCVVEIAGTKNYARYPNGFATLQDIYVISKGELPSKDIDFTQYP